MVAEVFHQLKSVLKKAGHNTNVGDEGGFAPNLDNEEAIKFILDAVDKAGYRPAATRTSPSRSTAPARSSSTKASKKGYKFWKSAPDKILRSQQMIDLFASWVDKYPIISIEDPLDQDDWAGYAAFTKALGDKVQIVGDDFFVTNTERLAKGIAEGATNSILIKVNQIGTLTETLDAIEMAHRAGYTTRDQPPLGRDRGHDHRRYRRRHQRGQIKTGSASRSDRIAKYNQLLRIEEDLGARRRLRAGAEGQGLIDRLASPENRTINGVGATHRARLQSPYSVELPGPLRERIIFPVREDGSSHQWPAGRDHPPDRPRARRIRVLLITRSL